MQLKRIFLYAITLLILSINQYIQCASSSKSDTALISKKQDRTISLENSKILNALQKNNVVTIEFEAIALLDELSLKMNPTKISKYIDLLLVLSKEKEHISKKMSRITTQRTLEAFWFLENNPTIDTTNINAEAIINGSVILEQSSIIKKLTILLGSSVSIFALIFMIKNYTNKKA